MRLRSFQRHLGFLALFATVYGSISSIDADCITQAWVRAEDLTPSTIVQGSARVKISAGCPPVESVLLGLRLKERSFMKALPSREDWKWVKSIRPHPPDLQAASPWAFPMSMFENRSKEVAFHELLARKDAWIIREEERIVFETTQPIPIVEGASLDHDVVHHFSVLVPSTNFPPAQDYMNAGSRFRPGGYGELEIVDVESMNECFLRVSFANGTTEDISAGFTGFQPLYDPADAHRLPVFENITLKPMLYPALAENYTAQFISDLIFTEGSEHQFVTMVITRTGPARTFPLPFKVRGFIQPVFSLKWATEYKVEVSKPWHAPEHVLRSTLKDVEEAKHDGALSSSFPFFPGIKHVEVTMPSASVSEIQSHAIVTTTSSAFTLPVKVDPRYVTNFHAYYQAITSSLKIRMELPYSQTVDPGDLFATELRVTGNPVFGDDEEEWVPWTKEKMLQMPKMLQKPQPRAFNSYEGIVPVIVRPLGEIPSSPGCVHPNTNTINQDIISDTPSGCKRPLLTHYLDEGARGPIFVDRSIVSEILAEDPAQRDLRTPILQPVVSSPLEGEELIYRYYRQLNPERPPMYVGETWARKVVGRQGQD